MQLDEALEFFFPERAVKRISRLGEGNINETLLVELGDDQSWVLQRLHPGVFKDPNAVMSNMRRVTAELNRSPDDPLRFFQLGVNPQGTDQYIDSAGFCWRILSYIKGCRAIEQVGSHQQAKTVGSLLGRFHQMSAALDPQQLHDPLPGFHQTPGYLDHYDGLPSQERFRNGEEQLCREQIERLRHLGTALEARRNDLSSGVIHGDPKVGNFLFCSETDQAVSLIDLDTVKPGLLLHDLGDCLRSCCNPLGESPANPEETRCVQSLFIGCIEGYLQHAASLLTPADQELLVVAAAVISFELGLRFFTDHLEHDHYFKVHHAGQNLHRARIQLQLSRSILKQQDILEAQCADLLRRFG